MLIFPKKNISPIIIPELCYKDRYNNTNSYSEMNPSMFIDEDGNFIILVRCINYKKYKNKEYTIYEDKSNSIYYIAKGIIKNNLLDLENCEYQILNYEYNLPTFFSYWTGLEDIRFINKNTVLVNVPELNNFPSIYQAELNNNKIINFIACKPNNKIEKNWMPFIDDNNINKVIYSIDPFIIKSIQEDDFEEINISNEIKEKLKGYHGSTNGIEFKNNYNSMKHTNDRIFLIHKNEKETIHRWLIFNIETRKVIISEEFKFYKNSYIEFNCSLNRYNERFFITIGINDNKAYIIETCYDDIINMFKKNNINYPTIVSALYDIRNNNLDGNKTIDKYIDLSKDFLLTLPFPIIIFINKNKNTYNLIYNFRKKLNLLDKTCIITEDYKNTFYYKDIAKLYELQTKFNIININKKKDTPEYIISQYNKFYFLEEAIELNLFNSSHFIWMDFGINHVALNTELINEWIFKIPDKIKQLCLNPFVETIEIKKYFEFIHHNIAGGLFTGSKNNIIKYCELYKRKKQEIYNEGWYQLDEAIITIIHKENPELFELYYGDYQGIISNYLSPIHNIDLILNSSEKCINKNKNKEAKHILLYCLKYFKNNFNHELLPYFKKQILTINNRLNIIEHIKIDDIEDNIEIHDFDINLIKQNINDIEDNIEIHDFDINLIKQNINDIEDNIEIHDFDINLIKN